MLKLTLFCSILGITFTSTAFADGSLADYMNQPANPMNAALTINDDLSSSADIDPAGGALKLTITDGSVFELTIPAGALPRSTTITMSELTSFEHPAMAQASGTIGVQLSPDGLMFAKPVTLKILSKNPIAISSLVPITADHDGKDVRLASISPASTLTPSSVELTLYHFSPYVLSGSLTLEETIRNAFTRLSASRLESWTADQLLKMKQNHTTDPSVFATAFSNYFENVVKVQVSNVASCEGGLEAQRTLLGWMRQNELVAADPDGLATYNFKYALTSRISKYCRDRAITACYEEHRPFDVIQFAIGVERQAQLMGIEGDPNAAELRTIAEKCAHFELEMKSILSTNDPGEITVTAEAKIKLWSDNIFAGFQSDGTVQVTAMTLNLDPVKCTQTSLVAPAEETSMKMGIDTRFDQSLGVFIKDLYPKSVGTFSCTDDSDPPNVFNMTLPFGGGGPDDSFWGGMFLAFHSQPTANEYNVKKGRYEFYKWNVLYGETFATKKYSRSMDMLKEETLMTIYHRPLK